MYLHQDMKGTSLTTGPPTPHLLARADGVGSADYDCGAQQSHSFLACIGLSPKRHFSASPSILDVFAHVWKTRLAGVVCPSTAYGVIDDLILVAKTTLTLIVVRAIPTTSAHRPVLLRVQNRAALLAWHSVSVGGVPDGDGGAAAGADGGAAGGAGLCV